MVPDHYDSASPTVLSDDELPGNHQLSAPAAAASRVSTIQKADQYGENNIQIININKTADPLVSSLLFWFAASLLKSDKIIDIIFIIMSMDKTEAAYSLRHCIDICAVFVYKCHTA